jgi:hypothetical protein
MADTASAVNLPFTEAVDYFRQKTEMPSAHWTTVMDDAHTRSFAVAGATKEALIKDFRGAVDKAISQGTSFGEFRKDFDAIVKKHGWSHTGKAEWRAKIIYNTNLATAFAAGRYAQMTDPDVLAAYPYWEYVHVNCPNPRLQHVAWSGMVLRADDPFWATCYPPNGWGCHCIVISTNERLIARQGKRLCDSPQLQWQEYKDRTTGVVTKYPAGVDPGFVGNPGRAWAKAPVSAPRVKPIGAAPPVLAQPGATAVPPAALQKFMSAPSGAVQVGTLNDQAMKLLGAKTKIALLSKDTLVKQNKRHPELTVKNYEGLDQLIKHPFAIYDEGERHIRLVGLAGHIVASVILKNVDGDELFVKTFHAARLRTLKKYQKRQALAGGVAALIKRLGK